MEKNQSLDLCDLRIIKQMSLIVSENMRKAKRLKQPIDIILGENRQIFRNLDNDRILRGISYVEQQ